MNKFWKTLITVAVVSTVISLIFAVATAASTNYAAHAPLNFIFMLVALAAVIYLSFKSLKHLWVVMALCVVVTLAGCSYAKSNQQVLISSDCGVSWSKINPGEIGRASCRERVSSPV